MKNLRKLLKDKSKPLVIPGIYDAIGAKIVEKVGFEAMFQTLVLTRLLTMHVEYAMQFPFL